MCIAVAKQAGLILTEKTLRNCFENNPDGAGFCIEANGNLTIFKGYFTFEDFYAAYRPHEAEKALLHFRIRTHGNIDVTNCHPFVVSEDIAFVHNGIINSVSAKGAESDTIRFNQLYLQPIVANLGQEALTSPALKKLIEHFIGYSKLAMFVKGQEEFLFFNENLGNRSKEGIWFSNLSWQSAGTTVTPPRKHKYSSPREKDPLLREDIPFTLLPQPAPASPERKEVDFLELPNGNLFCFGTIVETTWPINRGDSMIPKGALGEVERVYNDRTMDIDFYFEGKVEKIYPYALQIVEETERLDIETLKMYSGEGI